ncbi:MAG: FecR domain-containing protein [Chitinophagaceae bacterium]|nr:FecR domain-containing protein [Chitinophagaceae bacterium]
MNKDLLKRYFENACTPEEREKVALWLADPQHREEVLAHMEEEWDHWLPSKEDLEVASKEADLSFSTLYRQAAMPERTSTWKILSGVAASLLFLLAGAWIGYYYHGRSLQEQKGPSYYATAQTLRGQRSKLVLSDGSEVYLNAESRLSFSNEVSARPVVYLEGEAFFKVPEKEKPLVIKTRDLVATTKGSQFNISAFPKDSTVTVSVEKGKTEISANNEKTFPLIALRIPHRDSSMRKDTASGIPASKTMPMLAIRPLVLKANESVTYDKYNKLATAPARLNEEELRSWKEGFIYFNHPDSAALVDKLERWFDVEVSLNTGGIPLNTMNCGIKNATLTEVLDHIGNDLGLDYRIDGKHVYLSRRAK